nr:glucan endo-1,3-beta-D-glucosidase [Candidatus Neomarinimicrobiota bacterium]
MLRSFVSGIVLYSFLCFNCEKNGNGSESENNEPVKGQDWDLVWSDEFDGTSLDQSKWNILRWRPGWVNNELQAYTSRDTNIYLENGSLVLRALIEPGYFDSDY